MIAPAWAWVLAAADNPPELDVSTWTPLLIALLGGAAGVFIKGLFDRPQASAGARQTNVSAEVSLSADSREWVTQAMDRAQRAERRLDTANRRIDILEDDNDELRLKFNMLIDYVLLLHRDWGATTKPPPPPRMLRLEPHHRPPELDETNDPDPDPEPV